MSSVTGKTLSIGDRIRQERKRVRLTQEELAAEMGVHTRTQANYELGKTKPDMAYFDALRRVGIDDTFVLTGAKSNAHDELLNATERLFLRLCDGLQIPLEKVQAAINAATDRVEVDGQVSKLMKASPLLNSKNKVLILDRDILVDTIYWLERYLLSIEKRVSPLHKAHAIVSLYRYFSEKGEIDREHLEASAREIPKD